jgi:Tetracyclin repressor-like, C-terminal domain
MHSVSFASGLIVANRPTTHAQTWNPTLAQLMFSHPFAAFDPRPEEAAAGANVREFIITHVRRCSRAGLLKGNTTDIAHTLLALAQGLAVQESAGWLGTTQADRNRRWRVAFGACLDGFSEKR